MLRVFARMPFYAVARGKQTGIFSTWDECQMQVKGFSGAVFKKFKSQSEAEEFIDKKSEPAKKKRKVEYSEEEDIRQILALVENCDDNDDDIPPVRKQKKAPSTSSSSSSSNLYKIKSDLPGETTLKKYGQYLFSEDSKGFVHVFTDG
jgi:viroplasmin and RNaseH domain-containing protein